jgi:hypothetical protein
MPAGGRHPSARRARRTGPRKRTGLEALTRPETPLRDQRAPGRTRLRKLPELRALEQSEALLGAERALGRLKRTPRARSPLGRRKRIPRARSPPLARSLPRQELPGRERPTRAWLVAPKRCRPGKARRRPGKARRRQVAPVGEQVGSAESAASVRDRQGSHPLLRAVLAARAPNSRRWPPPGAVPARTSAQAAAAARSRRASGRVRR